MHKWVILLVRAEDKNEAKNEAKNFMNDYHMQVQDRYELWGRRTGLLSKMKHNFEAEATKFLDNQKPQASWHYSKDLVTENFIPLQKIWAKLGGKKHHPRAATWNEMVKFEDIVPLVECIDEVRNYCRDPKTLAQEYWDNMIREKKQETAHIKRPVTMSGYYAIIYGEVINGYFNTETDVYDCDYWSAWHIPEDMKDMRAIVIDMHH